MGVTLASVGSAPVEEEASESADASVETSSGADAEVAGEEQASNSASDEQGADDNDQPKPPRKGRPSLRVIK